MFDVIIWPWYTFGIDCTPRNQKLSTVLNLQKSPILILSN